MNWVVITLKSNQSKKAENNLISQGFCVFFPRIFYKFTKKILEKDLFSGYAFVQLNNKSNLSAVNSTRGVSKILRVGEKIPIITDEVIQNIRLQIKSYNDDYYLTREFQINDQVIIRLNIFNDQPAEIINIINKNHSQKVLLKLLNTNSTLWIDSSHLSQADDKQSLKSS